MLSIFGDKDKMVSPEQALSGRAQPVLTGAEHHVFHRPLLAELPDGIEQAVVAMGCFWGAERMFWQLDGVWMTAAGYAAGYTPNPTYEEVCSGKTGHNEVVLVDFDPSVVSYQQLLQVFWQGHDPTQGMRQGNDRGTQYRSGVYTYSEEQARLAQESRAEYAPRLAAAGYGAITTEIVAAPEFYYAEDYHQQYLAKNPNGYCGLGGTGVSCPIGTGA